MSARGAMTRPRRARARRRRRAVAFLYFTIVAMPLIFFSAAAAVDFTRIIIAAREVSNATAAAALAGAWQMEAGQASVNPTDATTAAVETYCAAERAGATHLSSPVGPARTCAGGGRAAVTVTLRDYRATAGGYTAGGYTTVEVTSRYRVDDLIFFSYFGGGSAFEGPPVTRSASVCVPGDTDGATQGFCQRPAD